MLSTLPTYDRSNTTRHHRRLLLEDPADRAGVAAALAEGAVVGHGFANFYVLTTCADAATVRSVNLLKGRPPEQTGSITTTPSRVPTLYDWSALPAGFERRRVLDLVDAFFALGPFGFRGPAAADIPPHLTEQDGDIRTTQVIAPGYACASNDFLARSLAATRDDLLYVTSANRSRHLTGAGDEPAHYAARGLHSEFGNDDRFVLLEHADEAAARSRYPRHDPISTTILAFHKTGGVDLRGRTKLVVERHGSLPLEVVGEVLAQHGFGLALGPLAGRRLEQRRYDTTALAVGATR